VVGNIYQTNHIPFINEEEVFSIINGQGVIGGRGHVRQ
jgi:hypothetical protein